jgi:hypothetical protein
VSGGVHDHALLGSYQFTKTNYNIRDFYPAASILTIPPVLYWIQKGDSYNQSNGNPKVTEGQKFFPHPR